jgi:protein-disulfide isomerase
MDRFIVAAATSLAIGCATWSGEAPSPTIASDGDIAITLEELDDWVKEQLFQERTEGLDPARVYEVRMRSLDPLIEQRVIEREAQRRGVTTEELLASTRSEIQDADIEAFFEENKEHLVDENLEELKPRIRGHLQLKSQQNAIAEWVRAADVRILLEPPRIQMAAVGPARGPADAPVTIVEFSDFQCPFCQKVLPTLAEIHERYPEEVRLVFRHLPLENIHSRARPAAIAAVCLEEQGRFWEFHDAIFADPRQLADSDLRQLAEEIGADPDAYDVCIASDAAAERVDADVAAARGAGISGTPAFFINGVQLSGAQPMSAFERVIERELSATAP